MSERLRSVWVTAAIVLTTACLVGAVFSAGRADAALQPVPRSVLVLQVGWDPTGTAAGSRILRPADAYERQSEEASAWFKSASHEFVPGWTTDIRGGLKIPAPQGAFRDPVDPLKNDCTSDFFVNLAESADEAARANGIEADGYDLVVYAYDEQVCLGMNDSRYEVFALGKRLVVQDARFRDALITEVGHRIGLGDAEALACTEGGAPVPLSESCTTEFTADPYDSMGTGVGAFNAVTQNALGWFGDDSETKLVWGIPQLELAQIRNLEIAALALPGVRSGRNERAIRLEDGGEVFWLEYRSQVGVDVGSGTAPGLVLHRELPGFVPGFAPRSQLLDMSPSTARTEAGLAIGQSWVNPKTETKITLTRADAGAAEVHLEGRPATAPNLPPPVFHPGPPVPNPDPKRSILVLNVGWAAPGDFRNWSPLDESLLGSTVANVNGPVNDWFRHSAPPGFGPSWTAHPGGSFTIPQPTLPSGVELHDCTLEQRSDFSNFVAEHANSVARQAGFDPSRFRFVLYVYTETFCGFAGLAPANRILASGGRVGTLEHELGHHLGLGHAERLKCFDDAGHNQVSLNDDCFTEEYGDPTDVMGSDLLAGSFNAPHAFRLGWLSNQFVDLADGVYAKTFQLKPYGLLPGSGVRALRLRDRNETIWLEYRSKIGVDLQVAPGLYIHREKPGDAATTQLIDTTPGRLGDENLEVGRTWIDPLGFMQVTLNSASSTGGASVTISRTPKTVTVPDIRGLTDAQVPSALSPAGLVYGGIAGHVEDNTCALINRVVFQSPSAGTKVIEGATVTVKMGVTPKTSCF